MGGDFKQRLTHSWRQCNTNCLNGMITEIAFISWWTGKEVGIDYCVLIKFQWYCYSKGVDLLKSTVSVSSYFKGFFSI